MWSLKSYCTFKIPIYNISELNSNEVRISLGKKKSSDSMNHFFRSFLDSFYIDENLYCKPCFSSESKSNFQHLLCIHGNPALSNRTK